MCLRTSTKRAMLVSEGDVRNAYGVHTVRISKYGGCSETCLPWQGKVYVDDVYSGGTKEESKEKNLTLLSEAIEGGLFHPNCKHRSTTYFYDLKKEQGKLQDDGIENPPEEQERRKNQLHIQQQKRIVAGSLDEENVKTAEERQHQWEQKDEKLLERNPEMKSMQQSNDQSNERQSELGKFKKQLSRDNVDVEYRKVLQSRFSHGSKDAKAVYNKYVTDGAVEKLDYFDVPRYNENTKKIYLNSAIDIQNERGAGVTWFHEHGHLIDDALGNISDSEEFRNILEKDVYNYRLNYGRKHKLNTWNKVDAAISNDLNTMRNHSAVSDLMEGITKGNISGVAGHGAEYWKADESMISSEAFAHMFEAQFDQVRYKELEKYFPNSLKYFEKMLKEVVK